MYGINKKKIYLYLKLDADDYSELPSNARDVKSIGHFGTGNLELTITNQSRLEEAKSYIQHAFREIGG